MEPLETHEADSLEEVQSTGPVATLQTWNELISNCFAQFREVPKSLRFPWEAGTMAAVFNPASDPLLLCPGISEMPQVARVESSVPLQQQLSQLLVPEGAKYMHPVKSIQDMSYFDGKTQQLELACGQWLRIPSGIRPQLAAELQKDSTSLSACEILKACFASRVHPRC